MFEAKKGGSPLKKLTLVFAVVCFLFSSCSYSSPDRDTPYSAQYFCMDTVMDFISVYGESAQEATEAAVQELERLDALLSAQTAGSEIYLLNETGSAQLSSDTLDIVRRALSVYDSTSGAFDITVYPLMRLWGFYTDEHHVPTQEELQNYLSVIGSDKISLSDDGGLSFNVPGMGIDLGAIAKGYAAQRVIDIFESSGIESAIVSLGGSIIAVGTKPDGSAWRVGVQAPDGSSDIIGTLSVSDVTVVTSGGYRRYFEDNGETYHHILDPHTGVPADSGLVSVSIISEDPALADALSTALFVMGREDAEAYWRQYGGFDFVLICDDGTVVATEGIKDSFSYDGDYEVVYR